MEKTEKKLNLLVLFGGKSTEHEISCLSVASILRVINKDKYNISVVGITKRGKWILTEATADEIEKGDWIKHRDNLVVNIRFGDEITLVGEKIIESENSEDTATRRIDVDCVFPVLHGQNGEDGTIQGMLEIMGLPYVGCKTLSSAVCMDKAMTKKVIENSGKINQTKYLITSRKDFMTNPFGELERIHRYFEKDYPIFVKPSNGGSSLGISKVKEKDQLFEAIKMAAEMDGTVVIEKGVIGKEIEVAVLGNISIKSTNPGEILSSNTDIYDYEAKYHSNKSRTQMVDYISEDLKKEIRNQAEYIYRELNCKGLARVDFFLTENNQLVFNEINTMPGFTKISMYPKMWESMGLEYEELIDKLIDLALDEI